VCLINFTVEDGTRDILLCIEDLEEDVRAAKPTTEMITGLIAAFRAEYIEGGENCVQGFLSGTGVGCEIGVQGCVFLEAQGPNALINTAKDAFAVDTKGEDEVEAAIQALEERLRALPAAPEQPCWCF
jgi:hypothetical protein